MTRPAPLSGFPEFLPSQGIAEQTIIDRLRETFELHGFAPLETRFVEPVEPLLPTARAPVRRPARPAAPQGRDVQRGLRPAPAPGRSGRRRPVGGAWPRP